MRQRGAVFKAGVPIPGEMMTHTVKLSDNEYDALKRAQQVIMDEGLGNPKLRQLIGGPNTCRTTALGVIVQLGACAIINAFKEEK